MSKVELHPDTNLFTLEVDAYAQGCNTLGLMGAGIAKQFRDLYPEMADAYKEVCKRSGYSKELCGSFFLWEKSTPIIYNLFTQFQPGRHPENEYQHCLEIIQQCFYEMFNSAVKLDLKTIGIPCIGAGIYRLKWDDVLEQIIQAYDNSNWTGTVHVALN